MVITNQLVIANVFRIPPKPVGLYPRVDRRPSEHIFQVQKCDHQHTRGSVSEFHNVALAVCWWMAWKKNPKLFLVASNTSASRKKNALFAFTQNIFPVLFSRLEKLCETRFKIASFIFWFRFCCGDFFTRLSLRELNEKKKRNKLLSNIVELRRWKIVEIVSTCEP